MNSSPTSQRTAALITAEILAIQNPVKGTLTKVMRPLKNGATYPHYHLQRWTNGKNVTTHVPIDKVEHVKKGIEQQKKLDALMDELAQAGLCFALKAGQEADDVKKKPRPSCSAKRSPSKSPKPSPPPSKR